VNLHITYEEEQKVKNQALDQISEQILAGFTSGIAQPDDEGVRVSWSLRLEVIE